MHKIFKLLLIMNLLAFSLTSGCSNDRDLSGTRDVNSGGNFFYYDQEDRMAMVEAVASAIETKYALLPIKSARLGVDHQQMWSDALSVESEVSDAGDSTFAQARSNLEFLDRIQKGVASYKDSHFASRAKNRRPKVLSGISTALVNGSVVISNINKNIMEVSERRFPHSGLEQLELGDQVLSINSRPVMDVVREFIPYVNASSEAVRIKIATEMIGLRRTVYPTKDHMLVKVMSRKSGLVYTVRIPFYYDQRNYRLDANTYFSHLDVPNINDYISSEKLRSDRDPMKQILQAGVKSVMQFSGKDGDDVEPVVLFGYYIKKGEVYGVLKLLSFNYDTLVDELGKDIDFPEAVSIAIQAAKDMQVPLIVDLRDNGGGNGSFPGRVMSMLAKSGEEYPDTTVSFRVTHMTRQMIESWSQWQPTSYRETARDVMNAAVESKMELTYEFNRTERIVADEKIGGFDFPVVALINEFCASACDMQSMLFKQAKHVKIIGTASNGTGAGFRTSTPYSSSSISGPFDVLSFSVPNQLFGTPVRVGKLQYDQVENIGFQFNSENRPTHADIEYIESIADVIDSPRGWLDKAVDVIKSQQLDHAL